MKLRPRDVVSHQGRDFVVEGVLTYKFPGRTLSLARAVDGGVVRWIEPLVDVLDDRLLFFEDVTDVSLLTPPPAAVTYRGASYVPRFSGSVLVEAEGDTGDRTSGPCEVWRYRAAGDVFLQIEKWPSSTKVLVGQSAHKDMVSILPAS